MGRFLRLTRFGIGFTSCGCATALSGFQPAHVPEKGHVQAEAGFDVSIPTGSVKEVIDTAETLDAVADNRALTDSEKQQLVEAGVNLALNPPTAIPHVGAAYAPFQHWEIGARFAASGWRLGVRRQLLHQDDHGVDVTVGVGVGRAAFEPPVGNVLDTVEIQDFVRWNFDLPITLGRHGDWYRWWAGPRLIYSSLSQRMTFTWPFEGSREIASISGNGFYVGGYAGAAFGYRWLFIGPELTLVHLFGRADIDAFGAKARVDADSFIVYPGLALMGEF